MESDLSKAKIKVLFVTSNLRYGGAEKMIVNLANQLSLKNDKYEVTIYSYENGINNYLLDKNIRHVIKKKSSKNKIISRLSQIINVRRTIRNESPDIVISFLTNQNVYSIIGTLFTKIPVIISERGNPYSNTSIIYKLKYLLYNFSDLVVFQTQGAKNYFNSKIQSKSEVIANPVLTPNVYVERKFIERSNSISFVGRFETKQKRQDIMLEAFSILRNSLEEPVFLEFYGDGDDFGEILTLSKEMNLYEFVNFHGKVDNVLEHIIDSKLYVLTSDYEGIPNSLIEAMSIGLPVISTKSDPGGPQLLIDNGVNGILVEKGNSNEIAKAMLYYFNNPNIADNYGNKAKEICTKFSTESIVDKWERTIKDVIIQKEKVNH